MMLPENCVWSTSGTCSHIREASAYLQRALLKQWKLDGLSWSNQIANGQTIMSVRVGAVWFKPRGKENIILEFDRVLHVPNLASNLLSVLYLTKKKKYYASIFGSKMTFTQNKVLHFTATVITRPSRGCLNVPTWACSWASACRYDSIL
jgi:hypothetical protein